MGWAYPPTQAAIVATFGTLFGALQVVYEQVAWYLRLARRLWTWRDARHAYLETWLDRLDTFDRGQRLVLERVVQAVTSGHWAEAQAAVRACAATPGFHRDEAWVDYGRLIKANRGQAQNVFRHLKAVSAIRPLADVEVPRLSNPEAHLLIELAYQEMAALGRPGRRMIQH